MSDELALKKPKVAAQAAAASFVDAVLKSATIHLANEGVFPTNWNEVEKYSGSGFKVGNAPVCSIGNQLSTQFLTFNFSIF